MIVVGITGSIGMGKSTVTNMFRELGFHVFDSDASVHQLLTAGGKAVDAVAQKFPEAFTANKSIDRQILGRIVFNDADKLKALEDILHPIVRAETQRFIDDNKGHMVALDIPLLFETGAESFYQPRMRTVCVTAPAEAQKTRVMARPGMTEEKFAHIIASQMADAEKRRRANYVVETDKDLADVRRQVEHIYAELKKAAQPAKNHV